MRTNLPYGNTVVKRVLPYGSGLKLPIGNNRRMPRDMKTKLKEARDAQGLTQEQLAEDIGLSVSQISRFESGAREPRVAEIAAIAKRLCVSASALIEDTVVSVVGRIGAGAEVVPIADQSEIYEVETTVSLSPGMVGFEVDGDSMWPRYEKGDILICSADGTPVESLAQDAEAAVELTDGRRFIKRVRRENGGWRLDSHNAKPIENVKIVWASKVAHVIRVDEVRRVERLVTRVAAAKRKSRRIKSR
jgi:transcriptional regulator with XRE-family HTH domain